MTQESESVQATQYARSATANRANLENVVSWAAINDTIGQRAASSGVQQHPLSTSPNLRLCFNGFQIAIIISMISFFIWFVLNFHRMNSRKVFGVTEILIFFWIIRCIWGAVNNIIMSTFYRANIEPMHCLQMSFRLSNLAGIFWCLASIYTLYISVYTDKGAYSYHICLVLFWLSISVYMFPKVCYVILCALLYFIVYIIVQFNTSENSQNKTPSEVIEKLKIVLYKDVKDEILESGMGGSSNRPAGAGALAIEYPTPTCPICIVELVLEDEIIIMPCDGRHYFHKECLHSWLLRSQECPICRTNVVEFLGSKNPSKEPINDS